VMLYILFFIFFLLCIDFSIPFTRGKKRKKEKKDERTIVNEMTEKKEDTSRQMMVHRQFNIQT